MAVLLQITYQKKLGLPNFSSHSCSVSVQVEVADLSHVAEENNRLYKLLQASVDEEIQKVGFMPDATKYGMDETNGNGNGHRPPEEKWNCSDKQRTLILKIVDESKLDKNGIDKLAQDRFGKSVKALNKLEASGLIEELIEQTGGKNQQGRFTHTGAR